MINSDKIKNLLKFEFKKNVINAIEDLCDVFEKIIKIVFPMSGQI